LDFIIQVKKNGSPPAEKSRAEKRDPRKANLAELCRVPSEWWYLVSRSRAPTQNKEVVLHAAKGILLHAAAKGILLGAVEYVAACCSQRILLGAVEYVTACCSQRILLGAVECIAARGS
jgi:hypothetical protein